MIVLRTQFQDKRLYQKASDAVCPDCGSNGYARVVYSAAIELICDRCGHIWFLDGTADDVLKELTPNKLRHMRKNELTKLAIECGASKEAINWKKDRLVAYLAERVG